MQIVQRVMLGILKYAINDSVVLHFAKSLQDRMGSKNALGFSSSLKPKLLINSLNAKIPII